MKQMRNLTYRKLMTVIRKIEAKGYGRPEAERVCRVPEPTAGHEHRGTSQEDPDERRVGKGMPEVWLLNVVMLPALLHFGGGGGIHGCGDYLTVKFRLEALKFFAFRPEYGILK
ncbi:MAG: hypothetical protein IJ719_18450 [Clostridia bacterium]|nr:hypothetical protein [Clostridia bacterium]